MPFTVERNGGLSRIRLQGAIDIDCAAELKENLSEGLRAGGRLCVSLEDVTGLDVTAVQLMWAAARESNGAGVEFAVEGQAEPVLSALLYAGFESFPVR